MRRRIQLLAGSYVLAAAAALVFGSTPAAAAPAALSCVSSTCNQSCIDQGYDYGRCTSTGCQCRIYMCGTQIC